MNPHKLKTKEKGDRVYATYHGLLSLTLSSRRGEGMPDADT